MLMIVRYQLASPAAKPKIPCAPAGLQTCPPAGHLTRTVRPPPVVSSRLKLA